MRELLVVRWLGQAWAIYRSSVSRCMMVGAICSGVKIIPMVFALAYGEPVRNWVELAMGCILGTWVIQYFLSLYRGVPWWSGDMRRELKRYLSGSLAAGLGLLAVGVGLVLWVLPGVIAQVFVSQWVLVTVDREVWAWSAIVPGIRLTRGRRWQILWLWLIGWAIWWVALPMNTWMLRSLEGPVDPWGLMWIAPWLVVCLLAHPIWALAAVACYESLVEHSRAENV